MVKKFFSVIVLSGLIGCQNSSEQVVITPINGQWDLKKMINFPIEVKDVQNPKNIIFVVRNNNDYPYSNIRFIVKLSNEKGDFKKIDTVNYILAQPNGKWIGSGFGETKETLFQYKLNYNFPKKGKYNIGILQAMRLDKLPGIEDIGIKIEQAEPNNGKNTKH